MFHFVLLIRAINGPGVQMLMDNLLFPKLCTPLLVANEVERLQPNDYLLPVLSCISDYWTMWSTAWKMSTFFSGHPRNPI